MKSNYKFLVATMSMLAWTTVTFAGDANCGLKPVPKTGCHIGDCVGGKWEQVCDEDPTNACGAKPVPKHDCKIGKCVNKHWQEICTNGSGEISE